MKKLVFILLSLLAMQACCNREANVAEVGAGVKYGILDRESLPAISFDGIFAPIETAGLAEEMAGLIGKEAYVITAGTAEDHNSMVGGWGGWGLLFDKPVVWSFLHASRYTLEYIRREGKYTICFFDEAQQDEFMFFGSKSGRGSDKMREHTLLPVATPGGSIAYKEAKLVIECTLTELTTVLPGDLCTPEGREFAVDGYGQGFDYRLVFGEVTGAWTRK